MKKHNLHIHTNYSDGSLQLYQIAPLAINQKLEIIGITDHAFTKKLSEVYQIKDLDKYIQNLKEYKIYEPKLKILKGIEIDVSLDYGINPKELPFDKLNQLDYILFEYVNTLEEDWGITGNRDISEIVNIRNRLKIPVGLAHNDIQKNYNGKEKEIAKILGQENIFIELNTCPKGNRRNGISYFNHFNEELIGELNKNNVRFVIGTDSHDGNQLAYICTAEEFMQKHNLKPHPLVE